MYQYFIDSSSIGNRQSMYNPLPKVKYTKYSLIDFWDIPISEYTLKGPLMFRNIILKFWWALWGSPSSNQPTVCMLQVPVSGPYLSVTYKYTTQCVVLLGIYT